MPSMVDMISRAKRGSERGAKPQVTLSLRLNPSTVNSVDALAKKHNISFSGVAGLLICEALQARGMENDPTRVYTRSPR